MMLEPMTMYLCQVKTDRWVCNVPWMPPKGDFIQLSLSHIVVETEQKVRLRRIILHLSLD